MKKALLLVSLYFLGCYQDETGTVIMKFDAGRSYGGAIGTPVGLAGAGEGNGTAAGGVSGAGQPGTTEGAGSTGASQGGASADSVPAGLAGAAAGGQSGGTGGATGTGPAASTATQGGQTVGNRDAGAGGTPARDAGGGSAGTTGTSTSACVAAASGGPSGMKTGQDCVSCHASGQSPKITAGGTLYSTTTGGSAVAGATITITDSKGAKIKMITGKTGNFYTGSAISFPATVEVSKCPDTVTMKATITEGGCNSCHNSSLRLHLP